MKSLNTAGKAGVVAFTAAIIIGLASWINMGRSFQGTAQELGEGEISSFVELASDGTPTAVGVSFDEKALESLPEKMNTTSRCHDMDGNGSHSHGECSGDYELILDMPSDLPADVAIPFKWVMVNWNPEGHMHPAPSEYAKAHFDFHFYSWDREKVEQIGTGPCGEFVDCEHFRRASVKVADEYLPPGHIDVGAVVPRMGNHLLDSQSPELQQPPAQFTRTFIYGAYEGELIFWEPMITRDFIRQTTEACFEIRQPAKMRRTGYYPAEYCIRHDAQAKRHTVSLEKFRHVVGS